MVTRKDVMKARTPAGGWKRVTLAKWGIAWPPTKGWIERLTGEKSFSDKRNDERLEAKENGLMLWEDERITHDR